MKVFLSHRVQKFLDSASADLKERLQSKIAELLTSPYPTGCKRLKGAPNAYRLRVGDYRILYSIVEHDEIIVFKIGARESVYE
ncbi:MAG: type II toxin-antitoxin system RelE/ParE family toxin [archaeon]|nr:MAG: type II toxin-antitoxin system RelE/ParE family toxin [archaeon]